MGKVKLAIVDDHDLFRDGLTELIMNFGEYDIIIAANNGKDFIEQVRAKEAPEIVLLDINMKEMDGFDTASWLKDHFPEVKVLALSMYENENAIIRMLRLGARGYILKNIRKKDLQEALISVRTKGYYYSESVTGKLIHVISHFEEFAIGSNTKTFVSLAEKELEFLKLVCTEMTYREIADKMFLSTHTIDGYRDALFQKLNVKSRVGLVLYAIKNKIVLID